MRNGNIFRPNSYSELPKSSYPTYEEWKPIYFIFQYRILTVLILPMRNGNKMAEKLVIPGELPVLILPMRNGNK